VKARGRNPSIKDFLSTLPEMVRHRLPGRLKKFQAIGPMFSLIKLHYGNRAVHYEVWVQRRTDKIELGLHFEADPQTNSRYLESLSRRFSEIQSQLGPLVEPEQWTDSWTRIHQSLPLGAMDETKADEVASRLAAMISVLQPMVEETDQ